MTTRHRGKWRFIRIPFTAAMLAATGVGTLPRAGAAVVGRPPQPLSQRPAEAKPGPDLRQAVTGAAVECLHGQAKGFDCHKVDLLSFLSPAAVGGTTPLAPAGERGLYLNSLWGWIDTATHREFVLLGRVDGISFVEVTDPVNPRYLGNLPLHEGSSPVPWRDVKTYQHHAFVVADASLSHGLQIFDLTQLRDVKRPPVIFRETAHYDGFGSAHTLALDETTGYAYAAGGVLNESCGGGLHMIDVRTPTRPTFAGCYTEPRIGGSNGPGYIHEAQCVVYHGPDSHYQGQELCFNAAETALSIADVTDKSHPRTISIATYPNIGYAHQGWLTDDHRYFFLDDELDGGEKEKTRTIVFDLTDLADPVVATQFFGTTTATDHNLYIRGRYMYQANYAAGLRVIDVADPTHPKEVGYFDTYPDQGKNAAGFVGAWSNFPYFGKGQDEIIAVSSIGEGLFMLQLRSPSP